MLVKDHGYQNGFNIWPMVWPGITGPLLSSPCAEIETPEMYYVPIGPSPIFRAHGLTAGVYTPGWGVTECDPKLDAFLQISSPYNAPEAVRWIDVQRCFDLESQDIDANVSHWEVVGFEVPRNSIAVIEHIETRLRIRPLSSTGVPLSRVVIDGTDPCIDSYLHPSAGVGSLRWDWMLVYDEIASRPPIGAHSGSYTRGGPVPLGRHLLPTWSDARYGSARTHAQQSQILVPARSRVRIAVALYGDLGRFEVEVLARLVGYHQSGGRRAAALASAVRRN